MPVVRPVGRRSGRGDETPVIAAQHDDSFLIALPYGKRTDWLKGVLDKGSATIVPKWARLRSRAARGNPPLQRRPSISGQEPRMHRQFHVNSALQVRQRPEAHP
jgi:hypothetical protein